MRDEVMILLDGKAIGTGLLIDGTNYAPVRTLAESLGLTVKWSAAKRAVELSSSGPTPVDPDWLEIIPQAWVEAFEPLPDGWLETNAPELLRKQPDIEHLLRSAAEAAGVSEKLLVTRMQLEQSAITYPWDGTTTHYGGGVDGEAKKLRYLCGVDRTDSGDRPNGWFGPGQQLLGCALRFTYWYRGLEPANPAWGNWLGFNEHADYQTGVPVTRGDVTIVPANQASADCLRYTTSMTAQERLRQIGLEWFPQDYARA